ncbi:hypothetical protein AJ78_04388 [Emergomyces pasteurianus Ep9510]|uniref:Enoyl reductase (ER) domain-containing protein n=1 Tax=Emergomyces pasteurianus Ep9510 TaxID=1447872 RepID=A0A1J9QGP6_9EURO|nr:hypothetical protein AJ78_04388 [Emergomyces pasteurianus Ep9510]
MVTQNTQKALISGSDWEAVVTNDFPISLVPAGHVLVKTAYVELNPADWMNMGTENTVPSTLGGCDFSGIVEEVGPAVTKKFTKGENVIGFNLGFNRLRPNKGAFAQYVITKRDLLLQVPESLPIHRVASMPAGLIYCRAGVVSGLGDGGIGDSVCKAAVGLKIREHTNNNLHHVYDTTASAKTAAVCSEALSSNPGGKYMATQFPQMKREDIESSAMVVYSAINEEFRVGAHVSPAKEEDFEFAKRFGVIADKLVAEGKVRAHNVLTNEEGWGNS